MAEELKIVITVEDQQAAQKFQATASGASKMAANLGDVQNAIQTGVNPSLSGMIALLTTAAAPLAALAAIVAVVTAEAKAFEFIVTEADQAGKVMAQTEAVIKSTGGVAGVSAEMVEDLAGELSALTGIEDDLIQQSENLTLTFTNISKSIFPQVTATALDLSQAFGMDLSSATVMLDKALQDPIAGLTALRRVGVSFSEAEQNMIQNMVEHNRVAAAQGLILQAVSKQVEGSAEAVGNTVSGQWAKLSNMFKNVAEDIGKNFTPLISAGLGSIVDVMQEVLKGAQPMFKAMQQSVKDFAATLRTPEMRNSLKELGTAIGDVIGELGPSAIKIFAEAFVVMAKIVATQGPQMVKAFIQIAEAAKVIAGAIAGVINALHDMALGSSAAMATMRNMPGFAGGVSNFAGGMAWVGENGPEPVFLPRGSTVLSNREAKEALSGGGGGMTFNNVTFAIQGGDRLTLEDLAQQIQIQTLTAGASA